MSKNKTKQKKTKTKTNKQKQKTPYERSELLAPRSTNTTFPIYLQNYIISLDIPSRKHRITHPGRCYRLRNHSESLAPVPSLPANFGKMVMITRFCVLIAQSVLFKRLDEAIGVKDWALEMISVHSSMGLRQILQLSRNASTTNLMHVTAI